LDSQKTVRREKPKKWMGDRKTDREGKSSKKYTENEDNISAEAI